MKSIRETYSKEKPKFLGFRTVKHLDDGLLIIPKPTILENKSNNEQNNLIFKFLKRKKNKLNIKGKKHKKDWSADEENLLMGLYKIYGNKWKIIASFFPKRSAYQLYYHMNILKRESKRSKKDSDNISPSMEYFQANTKLKSNSGNLGNKKVKNKLIPQENSFFDNLDTLKGLFDKFPNCFFLANNEVKNRSQINNNITISNTNNICTLEEEFDYNRIEKYLLKENLESLGSNSQFDFKNIGENNIHININNQVSLNNTDLNLNLNDNFDFNKPLKLNSKINSSDYPLNVELCNCNQAKKNSHIKLNNQETSNLEKSINEKANSFLFSKANNKNVNEKNIAELKEILNYLGFFLKDIFTLALNYETLDAHKRLLQLQSTVIATYSSLVKYMIANRHYF